MTDTEIVEIPAINEEKEEVLARIFDNKENIFVTGNAGTGKTLLLKHLEDRAKGVKREVAIVAPTGIAALNAGGQTIHSFFKIPPNLPPNGIRPLTQDEDRINLLKKLDILIIDEASMCRADLMDCLSIRLQQTRENKSPFGGCQVVLVGDLYQLPPVVTQYDRADLFRDYETEFFFSSNAYKNGNFSVVELRENFRQGEGEFLDLLNDIRSGTPTQATIDELNQQIRTQRGVVQFVPYNKMAQQINKSKLYAIKSPSKKFRSTITAGFKANSVLAEELLELKIGARVMLIANLDLGLVNGSMGEVVGFEGGNPLVKFTSGEERAIEKYTWRSTKYTIDEDEHLSQKVMGTFKQTPLKLSWANTIHKSQGLTFEKIHINLGKGAFAHGQVYVALSRCKTLGGISLSQAIKERDVMVDLKVSNFMNGV